MPNCVLPGDGRIGIGVTVRSPNGFEQDIELLADPGTRHTLIPWDVVDIILKSDPYGNIRIRESEPIRGLEGKALPTVVVSGLTLVVWVEAHGSGHALECRRSIDLRAHGFAYPDVAQEVFAGAVGLLGMDAFDVLRADPVKDRTGTRAYLAKRK